MPSAIAPLPPLPGPRRLHHSRRCVPRRLHGSIATPPLYTHPCRSPHPTRGDACPDASTARLPRRRSTPPMPKPPSLVWQANRGGIPRHPYSPDVSPRVASEPWRQRGALRRPCHAIRHRSPPTAAPPPTLTPLAAMRAPAPPRLDCHAAAPPPPMPKPPPHSTHADALLADHTSSHTQLTPPRKPPHHPPQ